jgi:hypothetical protein
MFAVIVLLRRTAVAAACLALAVCAASAGSGHTYDFLRSDAGARPASLGGSFTAMKGDPMALFYNPAGVGPDGDRSLSFGYFKHLLDINAFNGAWATGIEGLGMVGAGVVYVDYGDFDRTGEQGQNLGTFGAGELSVNVGYAGELTEGLRYGLGVKFVYSSIESFSSTAGGIDMGMSYDAIPERVVVAASLLHLGSQFDPYGTTGERLPLDLRVGAVVTPEHLPAAILLDFHRLADEADSFGERMKAFSVGAEFTVSPHVLLRAGYDNAKRESLQLPSGSGIAGFSAGAGIIAGGYRFDYAFSSNGPVGGFHQISVGF